MMQQTSSGAAPRVIGRFSCGAASAVAIHLALKEYGTIEIYYNDTGSEHPDNQRFLADCEKWYGQKINVLCSTEYKDTFDVWEKRRYLVSHKGEAPCTGALKMRPGDSVWSPGDREIFGYTAEEQKRVNRFREHNFERSIICPLIDAGLTKIDCLRYLSNAGIELPMMYKLGFANNNCIGCVKARDNLNYWKRIRQHFPEQFNRLARLERELGFQINRVSRNGVRIRVYLDEIESGNPTGPDPKISCGLFCGANEEGSNDE